MIAHFLKYKRRTSMDALPKEVITIRKDLFEPFKYGRKIGYYQLGRTIGEGSFAKVKEAIHLLTGEKVAVKIIDKNKAKEDLYISKNLRREARIFQLLRHPNIVQLFEVIETDGFYYLVMEYCAGGELLDFICSQKKLEESVARRLIGQLVSAVHNMHQSNIVHRDLKIENFLLSANENLKIVDFGLSNTLPEGCLGEYKKCNIYPQLLNTHCGSPAYAAPELLAQKKYGPQIDVWSIGINMYAMLTGYLPYMMEPFNVMEMYEKMMQRKMTPIPNYLSKECRDLLMRLLEPVPEWRISLRQVMKHQWFKDTNTIPPVFDDSINQLVEAILKYMKNNLNIKTKDAINAIVSNKANHSSAVYHLLNRKLTKYLQKNKNSINDIQKSFPKIEVIKKANLATENVVKTPSKSKFTYQGKKIDPNIQQTNSQLDGLFEKTKPDNNSDMSKNQQNNTRKISASQVTEYLSNIKKARSNSEEEKQTNNINKSDMNNINTNKNKNDENSKNDYTYQNKRPSIVDVLREDFIKGKSSTDKIISEEKKSRKRDRESSEPSKNSVSEGLRPLKTSIVENTYKQPVENRISNDSAYSGELSPFSDDSFKSPDDWFSVSPWEDKMRDCVKSNTKEILRRFEKASEQPSKNNVPEKSRSLKKLVVEDNSKKKTVENRTSNDPSHSGELSQISDETCKSPNDWFSKSPLEEKMKNGEKASEQPTKDNVPENSRPLKKLVVEDNSKKKPVENRISNDSLYSGELSPFSDDSFKSPDDWFSVSPWEDKMRDCVKSKTKELLPSDDKENICLQHEKINKTISAPNTSIIQNESETKEESKPDKSGFPKKTVSRSKKLSHKNEIKNPDDILRRFTESPKATQKRLRKVSCPVKRSSSPEHAEYGIENLKKGEQYLMPNVKTLKENKPNVKEIRHEFVKTPVLNKTYELNRIGTRETIMNRTNRENPSEIPQNNVKSNIESFSESAAATKMKDRSLSTGSVDARDFEIDENNNNIAENSPTLARRPKTSEPIPSINKISPSKKTRELNVKQFTQFKTLAPTSSKTEESFNAKPSTVTALKPLELNFNFDKYRKKKAYTKKQVTKSLTNINGVMKVDEKEPAAEQMLSMRRKTTNEDIRNVASNRGKEDSIPRSYPRSRSRKIHSSALVVSSLESDHLY